MTKRDRSLLFFNKNLTIIFGVTLIAIMGVTTIAPILPKISGKFDSKGSVAQLIYYFTLPGIFLAPVVGILADRIGRRRILAPSLFLFALAGSACAFVNDFDTLLLLRFFQGIGAASLNSLGVTLIGDIFTEEDRVTAMGYNSMVLSLGAAIYPSIGGAIALIGWNYPFLLSLAAIPVGLLVLFVLDNPRPGKPDNILDYLKNSIKHMNNIPVLGLYFASMATFILLYGFLLIYFPLFMKSKFGLSPFEIGLILSGASLATSVGAFNLGKLTARFSSKKLICFGFFLYAAAILAMLFFAENSGNLPALMIPVFIYGFANGINIPSIHNQVSSRASIEYRGFFMAGNSMVLRLGQTLGPMLAALAFALWGIEGVFYSFAVFSLISCLILMVTLKQ